ncbi:MAG: hypothetical protein U5L75_02945 [Candidatus Campbellbacteria bacterium]|nr:hypothetical protein [Candidatus Campbellbacteria bacterium]
MFHKRACQKILERLRLGTEQYEFFIERLYEEAHKGQLSLSELGVKEGEIERLRLKGCMLVARKNLDLIRKRIHSYKKTRPQNGETRLDNFPPYKGIVDQIYKEAQKGRFSLSDIGTNEEELLSFLQLEN